MEESINTKIKSISIYKCGFDKLFFLNPYKIRKKILFLHKILIKKEVVQKNFVVYHNMHTLLN